MKMPPKPKAAKPVPRPIVEAGDEVFFRHPKIGPHHGHVKAHGRDGCTVKDADGKSHKVPWPDVLGMKDRAHKNFTVVVQGESGAIAEDEDGNRRFIGGWDPDKKTDNPDDEPGDEDVDSLMSYVDGLSKKEKPMAKSAASAPGLLLFMRNTRAGR